ncbi:hypothetical protein L3556_15560 [Candidatus Synechococcus calcipolaris G9]|uniref:Uncharacterized protein n=1 Tax=Candidatus Synechococcus calcipolaris G9 TaxID=1497997 RepID=A0ABT6F382_9SYNE|nr:hypothetical protein [Candidatus Synechococcus calcipolaris]MDG2992336.1 hypothetical protein [Candidatus Synechococcus calcipolaris G9]
MAELTLIYLFSGSLGLSALLYSQWWFWQLDLCAQEQEEEEGLTNYQSQQATPTTKKTPAQLAGWEFKILRSQQNIFHQLDKLQAVCAEEAKGGWILLEKLDDRRLRFKRPMVLREKLPPIAGYDPYRCYYGSRFRWGSIFSFLILILLATLPAYLGYRLVILSQSDSSWTAPSWPPVEAPPQP